MFDSLAGDLGIDLGTANTLVHRRHVGIVVREPSVIAVEVVSRRVLAVGNEAKNMLGRTPASIVAVRPLKDGVIADFETTEAMLNALIRQARGRWGLGRPRLVIAVPSGITGVERRAVKEAGIAAGAREVHLVDEPMAAAIGVGLPIQEAVASMVVDIGGGTTEVAVIALGGMVAAHSARVGGDRLDEAIIHHLKRCHGLMIGERTAEEIKIRIGSAAPSGKESSQPVRGLGAGGGLPKSIELSSVEIRRALAEPVRDIVKAVRDTLERCPPELAADLVDQGMTLTGGGALLRGLDVLLHEVTGLPVHIPADPLSAVAHGTGRILEEIELLRGITDDGIGTNGRG